MAKYTIYKHTVGSSGKNYCLKEKREHKIRHSYGLFFGSF